MKSDLIIPTWSVFRPEGVVPEVFELTLECGHIGYQGAVTICLEDPDGVEDADDQKWITLALGLVGHTPSEVFDQLIPLICVMFGADVLMGPSMIVHEDGRHTEYDPEWE